MAEKYCEVCGEEGWKNFCKRCGGRLGEFNGKTKCSGCGAVLVNDLTSYCKSCGGKFNKVLRFDFAKSPINTTMTYRLRCSGRCFGTRGTITCDEAAEPVPPEKYCGSCGSRIRATRFRYAKCRDCGHVITNIDIWFFVLPRPTFCECCGSGRVKHYGEIR